jgi:hypothetical protein
LSVKHLQPGADDVVIDRYDRDESPNATTGSVTLVRVSGRDGTASTLGGTYASPSRLPASGFVPDQDGDGFEDAYLAEPGETGDLEVRSGRTGRRVWATAVPSARTDGYFELVGAGHTTGGIQDLVVLSGATVPLVVADAELPMFDPRQSGHGEAVLLAGGSGRVRWTRPADGAVAISRTSLALLLDQSDGSATVLQATGVGPDGTELWQAQVSVPGGGQLPSAWAEAAGDLDDDGATDLMVHLTAGDRRAVRFLAGATGRLLPVQDALALGASVDGRGDDLVRLDDDDKRLSVLDGATGRSLYSRAVADGADIGVATTPDRCADLLVSSGGTALAIAGTGAVRWTVHRSAGDLGAGVLRTGDTRARRC